MVKKSIGFYDVKDINEEGAIVKLGVKSLDVDVRSIALSNDDNLFVVTKDKGVRFWDVAAIAAKGVDSITENMFSNDDVSDVVCLNSGQVATIGYWTGGVQLRGHSPITSEDFTKEICDLLCEDDTKTS